MIEKVVNRKNMLRAYQQVMSNQGSAGVDGIAQQTKILHLARLEETRKETEKSYSIGS